MHHVADGLTRSGTACFIAVPIINCVRQRVKLLTKYVAVVLTTWRSRRSDAGTNDGSSELVRTENVGRRRGIYHRHQRHHRHHSHRTQLHHSADNSPLLSVLKIA